MIGRMRRCVLLLICLSLPRDSHSDPVAEAKEHHRDFQTEGEGIAIVEIAGETTTTGHAGKLRVDGPEVDEGTLFEIGSITKVFTGILLSDAVLKGKAALDDPISKHLPADLLSDDSPLQAVTLLDLTTHTSGLPRLPANLDRGGDTTDPYAHYDKERLYAYLKGFQLSDFKDRGKTSYSNLGVGLLGHLLERMEGKPYEDIVKETIFEPLGMKDSFVQRKPGVIPSDRENRFATGHSGGKEVPHWHFDVLAGAGAIVSSTRDLARFAQAYWSGKTPAELRAAMELAATPQRGEVGLGWFIGGKGLNHNGGTGGFRSEIRISLEEKTASVRLMNGTGPAPESGSKGDFTRLSGYWEGTLDTGKVKLPHVFRISKSGKVVLHSLAQGGRGVPADKVIHEDGIFRAVFGSIGGRFEATVEGDSLTGTWKQNGELPLTLARSPSVPAELETILAKRVPGDVSEVAGWWSGYLGGKSGLFVVLEVEAIGRTGEARLYSPDQTPDAFPVTSLSFEEGQLKLSIQSIGAAFAAKLGDDGRLIGAWKQGLLPQPLTLKRSEQRPERE